MTDSSNWRIEETPTLRDRTFEVLRSAILNQEFSPGERLVERTLATRIGVSRTSVREALGKLEYDGLVQRVAGKGVFVASVSEDGARQIYEARAILESAMARLFVERASDEELAALENAVIRAEETNLPDQALLHAERLDAVSDIIMQGARNHETQQIASVLRTRVTYLRTITTRAASAERRGQTIALLKGILNAFKSRDADLAERLTRTYVQRSEFHAIEIIRNLANTPGSAGKEKGEREGNT